VAERAGLLRLAGPGCARELVDARRGGAGGRAVRRPRSGRQGSRVEHAKLIEFIQRNYACNEDGCWFFQNGPQRVYVELEAAPWVWRLAADGTLTSHTGLGAGYRGSWLDEQGRLYVDTELGLGLVHSLDMHLAADLVEQGRWQPVECLAQELQQRFGFVLSPQAWT